MLQHGLSDIKTRVAYIPTRDPDETPQEALARGAREGKQALREIARLLARQAAHEQFEGTRPKRSQ